MEVKYNIEQIDQVPFNSEEYLDRDLNLISNQNIDEVFNPTTDTLEFHIYTYITTP